MKLNTELAAAERRITAAVDHRMKVESAITKTNLEISQLNDSIKIETRRLADDECQAMLDDRPADVSVQKSLLDCRNSLSVAEAKLSGLLRKRAEAQSAIVDLRQEFDAAKKTWKREATAEFLKKHAPAIKGFIRTALDGVAYCQHLIPEEMTGAAILQGLTLSIHGIEELAKFHSLELPAELHVALPGDGPEYLKRLVDLAAMKEFSQPFVGPEGTIAKLEKQLLEAERNPGLRAVA